MYEDWVPLRFLSSFNANQLVSIGNKSRTFIMCLSPKFEFECFVINIGATAPYLHPLLESSFRGTKLTIAFCWVFSLVSVSKFTWFWGANSLYIFVHTEGCSRQSLYWVNFEYYELIVIGWNNSSAAFHCGSREMESYKPIFDPGKWYIEKNCSTMSIKFLNRVLFDLLFLWLNPISESALWSVVNWTGPPIK